MLCDHFEPRKVVASLMSLIACGLVVGLLSHSLPAVICFIILFGFAMGGVMSTFPIIVADLFGRESFRRRLSLHCAVSDSPDYGISYRRPEL